MSDKDKFLFYTADGGAVKVEALCKEETVWLTAEGAGRAFRRSTPGNHKAFEKHL